MAVKQHARDQDFDSVGMPSQEPTFMMPGSGPRNSDVAARAAKVRARRGTLRVGNAGPDNSNATPAQKKGPIMPGHKGSRKEGKIEPLERACPAGENARDPDNCVLPDEDRSDMRNKVMIKLEVAGNAFVNACDVVKGTVAEGDPRFLSALLSILSTVATMTLSRAMGGVVERISDGLKSNGLLVHFVGEDRISRAVGKTADKQIGRGVGAATGNKKKSTKAEKRRGYIDVLKKEAVAEFDKVGGLSLGKLDDRDLVGLYESIKGKSTSTADYVSAIQAKLGEYETDVEAVGVANERIPQRVVWISNAGRKRAAICFDKAVMGGGYVFKSWVHEGLQEAAVGRQRETQKHAIRGTAIEDTVAAEHIDTEDIFVPGFGGARVYKAGKAEFDEWINLAIPKDQRGTWPSW